MKVSVFGLLTTLIVAISPWQCSASPVVPGLANKNSLSEPQIGELLLGELRCVACHGRKGTPAPLERIAPDLSDVGSRVAPEYLRRFIASPSASHAGTTMPDLLARPKRKISGTRSPRRSPTFLVAQSSRRFQREAISEKETSVGQGSLPHGWLHCRATRPVMRAARRSWAKGRSNCGMFPRSTASYRWESFFFSPCKVRPSGRMPDMKLTPVEAKAIASYLLGKADTNVQAASAAGRSSLTLGKKYFQQFNCAACHKLGDIPAAASRRRSEGCGPDARVSGQDAGQGSEFQSERRTKPRRFGRRLRSRPSRFPTRRDWP